MPLSRRLIWYPIPRSDPTRSPCSRYSSKCSESGETVGQMDTISRTPISSSSATIPGTSGHSAGSNR